jgi:hypothetical protein
MEEDRRALLLTVPVAEAIIQEVSAWPEVTVHPHARGFVELRVGRRELGHLHGDRLADLPFPVRVREQLVSEGKADEHYIHPSSGWVSFRMQGMEDVARAVELFRLNYDRPWLSSPSDAECEE